jgi:very-short-patch-repair endonuclease
VIHIEPDLLPASWISAELGQLVEVHYGEALSAQHRMSAGHVPVVGSSGVVGKHDQAIVEGSCIVVGRKGAAGSVRLITESCWPIDTAYYIQPPENLSLRYLSYQLGLHDLVRLDKSTAIPSLSRDDLYRVKISLAPAAEQTRIVAKLEELLSDLDAGVVELKAAQRKLTQYRQSLLKAAVEGALTTEWRQQQRTPSPLPLPRQGGGDKANEKRTAAVLVPLPPRGGGVRGEGAQPVPTQEWLNERARQLRAEQTPHEHSLWQQLRANRFSGFKFKRQQVIGSYIVDFVCFGKRLIIELDGSQHADSKNDAGRDAWLIAQGFRVLRFWNNHVQSQLDAVLESIWNALHEQSSPLPNPSPARGEGLESETGAQLLDRILKQRRARWEAKQLAKFKEQGKAPPKDWQAKYSEPVKPDTTDLPSLPEGWVWASLDQLAAESSYGTSVKCSYEIKGTPVLRIPNVVERKLDLRDVKFATQDLNLDKSDYLAAGDVLVVRTNGSISLVGRAAEVSTELTTPYYFASYLLRLRCIETRASAAWVSAYLASYRGRQWIEKRAASSAGQHNISLSTLLTIPVPLPPLSEQAESLKLLDSALQNIDGQEQLLAISFKQSAAQRKNILKAAFSGQLVPQDPNDEPASVLLERIRAERAASAKKPSGKRKPV